MTEVYTPLDSAAPITDAIIPRRTGVGLTAVGALDGYSLAWMPYDAAGDLIPNKRPPSMGFSAAQWDQCTN